MAEAPTSNDNTAEPANGNDKPAASKSRAKSTSKAADGSTAKKAPGRPKGSGKKTTSTTSEKKATTPSTPAKRGPKPKAEAPTPPPRRSASARKTPAAPKPAAQRWSGGKSPSETSRGQFVTDMREQMGDRNFIASVIGGVAAVGATVAGVLFAIKRGQGNEAGKKTDSASTKKPKD